MSKYGYRDITDVTFIDLATDKPVIFMDYLQTSSQAFGNEIVYAIGGRGAPKRVGFQSGNAMSMEMTSSLISPELLGIMLGTTVTTGVQYVPVTQKITATANTFNLAATPYTSDLTTYPVTVAYAADGSVPSVHLTKVTSATPAATEFDLTGLVVTVNSTTYASGGVFLVTYYKASTATNKRVKFESDKFAKAYKITGYTLWKNESDELSYPCRITIPKVQITIDGATLNSAMNGEPTTPVLKGEVLQTGTTTDMVIYDIDEGAGV